MDALRIKLDKYRLEISKVSNGSNVFQVWENSNNNSIYNMSIAIHQYYFMCVW